MFTELTIVSQWLSLTAYCVGGWTIARFVHGCKQYNQVMVSTLPSGLVYQDVYGCGLVIGAALSNRTTGHG